MENEFETPRPLDTEEIKIGVCQMISDAVYEQLGKTVNLYGRAYPKFKGTVTIRLELDDFGDTVIDNSITKVEGGEGEITASSVPLEVSLEIAAMPPNAFRMETDQPITKSVVEDGKTVVKNIRYQPRTAKPGPKPTAAKTQK